MGPELAEAEEPACCCSSHHRRPGWRSVKRKLDGMAAGAAVEGARVGAEDEVAALREAVESHQKMVELLRVELEEERAAAASAASEAMGMILRLQREKGEAQMEARQFRRFAEEKMAHDRQELLALEELLCEREQAILALSGEVQVYRDRLLGCGIALDSVEPDLDAAALEEGGDCDGPVPPVGLGGDLEWSPSRGSSPGEELEKEVVVGLSSQVLPGEPMCGGDQPEEFITLDCSGDDDSTNDRVYTVDAVHSGVVSAGGIGEDNAGSEKESASVVDGTCGSEEVDIRKLDMRLQALEADRESMRQAIVSIQADKAQLVLLKGIAQQLCRDVSGPSAPPVEGRLMKKSFLLWCFSFMSMIKATIRTSFLGQFSLMSTIKWIMSFVVWKKKTDRSKYTFGLSNNNLGLLLLLDNAPRIPQWRCHSRASGRSV